MDSPGASIDWIVLSDLAPGREPGGRSHAVDKDSLDEFLGDIAPTVDIGGLKLTFRKFKDFRPERLATRIPEAAALLSLRQRALDLSAGRGQAESLRKELAGLAHHPELAAAVEETPRPPAGRRPRRRRRPPGASSISWTRKDPLRPARRRPARSRV